MCTNRPYIHMAANALLRKDEEIGKPLILLLIFAGTITTASLQSMWQRTPTFATDVDAGISRR